MHPLLGQGEGSDALGLQVGSQLGEQFTVLLLHAAERTRVMSCVPETGTRPSEQPGLLRTRTQRLAG